MFFSRFLLLFMILYSSLSFAHGPTRQKVKESIEIKTSANAVWKMIKNLELAEKWHSEYSSISPKKTFWNSRQKEMEVKG